MSIYVNHEEVDRQRAEIEQARRDRKHRADVRRRRVVQALAVTALVTTAAQEAYRREVLLTLPAARFSLAYDGQTRDAQRWRATMQPARDTLGDVLGQASTHAAAILVGAVGGARRAQEHPWVSVAAAGFLTLRAAAAGRQLLREMQRGHLDAASALNAVTCLAAVPLAVPEAWRATRGLLTR